MCVRALVLMFLGSSENGTQLPVPVPDAAISLIRGRTIFHVLLPLYHRTNFSVDHVAKFAFIPNLAKKVDFVWFSRDPHLMFVEKKFISEISEVCTLLKNSRILYLQ